MGLEQQQGCFDVSENPYVGFFLGKKPAIYNRSAFNLPCFALWAGCQERT